MSEEELIHQILQESLSPPEIRDLDFPEQDKFVVDPSRYLAGQCTRRAGKSNGLGLRFFRTLEKHPGAFCPYIALTRESAKNIMWDVLQEQDERYKIGAKFTVANLTVTTPTGGRIQLFGADMKNFIRRLKGIKTPGAGIDECQDFGAHLRQLVDDVLGPAILDYEDGWLGLTGTPGPIPRGLFYEITDQKKFGFSVHKWSLFDNPYLPNARDFVQDLKQRKGWDDQNPTLLREYYNQWIVDLEALLVQYNEEKSHYETLPPAGFEYILGIDIGFEDADALAVIGWSEALAETYLIEEVVCNKQGLTELVSMIQVLQGKYRISKMMIDEGGLGKKLAEEIRRRHGIPVQAADKARKMENVAFLNDALRTGKFKAKKDSLFAQDANRVQIDYEKSTPSRIVVKSDFHSDIIDAVLYAWRESPGWSYQAPTHKPKYGSPEWAQAQVNEMENAAEEHFENLEELARNGF